MPVSRAVACHKAAQNRELMNDHIKNSSHRINPLNTMSLHIDLPRGLFYFLGLSQTKI